MAAASPAVLGQPAWFCTDRRLFWSGLFPTHAAMTCSLSRQDFTLPDP